MPVFFVSVFSPLYLTTNTMKSRVLSDACVKYEYFNTRGQNGGWRTASVGESCIFTRAMSESPGWPPRTIFFFTNSCEPELAHRLQTSKMRRNSTSLNSCKHDDINIVTVSVARRRWTAPLKPRKPCVRHFTTFYALVKHVLPKGDYFTPKGHYFAP